MSKTKSGSVLFALAALCGLAASASAENVTFAGLECVEANDTQPEIEYSGGNALNANDTHDAEFRCPIVRPSSNVSGNMTSLFVRVQDNHGSEAVDCFVRACNGLGTSCRNSSADASSGTGRQSLSVGSVSPFTNGYAYVVCTVPDATSAGQSGVVSYKIND